MADAERLEIRPAASTYVILGLLGSPVLIAILLPHFLNHMQAILFGFGYCLYMYWIWQHRILVDQGTVSYWTVFKGKLSLKISCITSAKTEIGIAGPFDAPYRLVLEHTDGSIESPLVINMKLFSRRDIRKLLEILGTKLVGSARLDILNSRKES